MPTYPFTCPNCGEFDVWQSIHAYDGQMQCECGAPAKRRYHGIRHVVKNEMVMESFMHPAFGEVVSTRADIANAKARTEARTGHELVNIPDLEEWEPKAGIIDEVKHRQARVARMKDAL